MAAHIRDTARSIWPSEDLDFSKDQLTLLAVHLGRITIPGITVTGTGTVGPANEHAPAGPQEEASAAADRRVAYIDLTDDETERRADSEKPQGTDREVRDDGLQTDSP